MGTPPSNINSLIIIIRYHNYDYDSPSLLTSYTLQYFLSYGILEDYSESIFVMLKEISYNCFPVSLIESSFSVSRAEILPSL